MTSFPPSTSISSTSERLDAIVRAAAVRLDEIVSDERFRALRCGNGGAFDFAARRSADVSFVVKFGSATLSLAEAAALDLESIVPLTDVAANGSVQIWANGRLCGRGILLTSRGKLAVKIESFDPNAAFE